MKLKDVQIKISKISTDRKIASVKASFEEDPQTNFNVHNIHNSPAYNAIVNALNMYIEEPNDHIWAGISDIDRNIMTLIVKDTSCKNTDNYESFLAMIFDNSMDFPEDWKME